MFSLITTAKSIDHYAHLEDYQAGTWALVDVDLSKLGGKTERINISMPERILRKIDCFASSSHKTRSKFLAEAGLEYIATHSED